MASIVHTAGMTSPGIEGMCHCDLHGLCLTHCSCSVSPPAVLSHFKPSLEGCLELWGIASDQKGLQSGIEVYVEARVVLQGMQAVYQHFALCLLLCMGQKGPFPLSVLSYLAPCQCDCSHDATLHSVNGPLQPPLHAGAADAVSSSPKILPASTGLTSAGFDT